MHRALLLFAVAQCAMPCTRDSDCKISSLIDFTSHFCVAGRCQELRDGGSPCTHPTQCASYSYYGPAACTAKCGPGTVCLKKNYPKAVFCCRSIPLGGSCTPNRPGTLSGCAAGQSCSGTERDAKCTEEGSSSWTLGITFSITGNILINTGVNIQKLSYRCSTVSLFHMTLSTMLLGTVVYAAGKIIAFSAYLFGAQSLLAGLSGIGIISNSVLAPAINHERFTWRDAAAIVFVLSGTGIMLANVARSHRVKTSCELFRMYGETHSILWFTFISVLMVIIYLFVRFVEVNSDWRLPGDSSHPLRRNIFFHETGLTCRYLMVVPYVLLSALIASFSALSAKSLGEILRGTRQEYGLRRKILILFLLASLIWFTIGQIYWLNRALRHYDALVVVPLFHVIWTILSITTAGIYFQDFDHYTSRQFKWFILSICIIFCGTAFLAIRIVNQNQVHGEELRGDLRVDRRR